MGIIFQLLLGQCMCYVVQNILKCFGILDRDDELCIKELNVNQSMGLPCFTLFCFIVLHRNGISFSFFFSFFIN